MIGTELKLSTTIADLPGEMVYNILSYVSPMDLINFAKVFKQFSEIANDNELWKNSMHSCFKIINLKSGNYKEESINRITEVLKALHSFSANEKVDSMKTIDILTECKHLIEQTTIVNKENMKKMMVYRNTDIMNYFIGEYPEVAKNSKKAFKLYDFLKNNIHPLNNPFFKGFENLLLPNESTTILITRLIAKNHTQSAIHLLNNNGVPSMISLLEAVKKQNLELINLVYEKSIFHNKIKSDSRIYIISNAIFNKNIDVIQHVMGLFSDLNEKDFKKIQTSINKGIKREKSLKNSNLLDLFEKQKEIYNKKKLSNIQIIENNGINNNNYIEDDVQEIILPRKRKYEAQETSNKKMKTDDLP